MPYIAFDGTSFDDVVKKMPEYLQDLRACEPFTPDERGYLRRNGEPLPKIKGVYCFYEGDKPMYVGIAPNIRARNIRESVLGNRRPRRGQLTMSFAFKLAKKEFEKRYPSANTEPLRMDDLPENLAFNRIFTKAKARVSKMSVRFVEIKYRRERTDFEMYAHMELGTPFNNL